MAGKIVKSFAWDFAGRSGSQVASFIIGIILARILTPVEFGLIAMAMVFIAVSEIFTNLGLSSALIQRSNPTEEHFSSSFYLNTGAALALTVLFIFGMKLHWFPIKHAFDDKLIPGFTLEFILSILKHLVLPLTVSVLVTLQIWIQQMRNTMVSVLAEDYITMAEAKGLTQNRIMFGYAARNAILPSVTGFGIFFGSILSGQLLIEQVFSYPGLGFLMVRAVGARDYPLMGGLFLGITVGVLLMNLLVDILYTRIDPRVRND